MLLSARQIPRSATLPPKFQRRTTHLPPSRPPSQRQASPSPNPAFPQSWLSTANGNDALLAKISQHRKEGCVGYNYPRTSIVGGPQTGLLDDVRRVERWLSGHGVRSAVVFKSPIRLGVSCVCSGCCVSFYSSFEVFDEVFATARWHSPKTMLR
jgi:hypothetical protein